MSSTRGCALVAALGLACGGAPGVDRAGGGGGPTAGAGGGSSGAAGFVASAGATGGGGGAYVPTHPDGPAHVGPTPPTIPVDAPPCTGCFVEADAGAFHTCARADDGRVACWGSNVTGQIGAETPHEETLSPREASPLWVPGLADVVDLGLGLGFSCAARASGRVVCWGDGRDMLLGSAQSCAEPAAPCRVLAPVEVPSVVDAVEVAAGDRHSCARTAQGEVWCWGRNDHGETGLAPAPSSPLQAPARVPDVAAARLFARGSVTCALGAAGALTCWGDGVVDCKPTDPSALATGVVDVAFGAGDLCVLDAGGRVRCRGANLGGELGAIHASHPCGMNDAWTDEWVELATGASRLVGVKGSMCIHLADGALRCFGDALPPAAKSLVETATLPGVTSLVGGAGHLVALDADGRVGALGANWYGQLGNGEAYQAQPLMTAVWTSLSDL